MILIKDIEHLGFEHYSNTVDFWFKFKESPITHTTIQDFYGYKPYALFLNYGPHDGKVIIKCDFSGGLNFDNSDTLFEGFCENIEELEFVLKLIKVI